MSNKLYVRPTAEGDEAAVMAMYDHSRSLMRASGNTTQWVGYPTLQQLHADMQSHSSYVLTDAEGVAVGTFAMVAGDEPTYALIEQGRWLDSRTPYATIHRVACAPAQHGIAAQALAFAKSRHPHLRIDTHQSNSAMLHIVEREGFVYCGIVYMADGTERLAYEWWRHDEVPASLKQYVEQEVLPQYDHFDHAHRRDHARRVMARAMLMMPTPMTYAAAAMHDLGLAIDREHHHLHSGRIVRSCSELPRWFSAAEIETIAQAVEDHRASATTAPRSPLGCVIAEADRDIEPETIVRRTVQYGLSHYPQLDREGHFARTLEHLREKYSRQGYLRLWLDDSPNAAPLEELRQLIDNPTKLQQLFDQYFTSAAQTA